MARAAGSVADSPTGYWRHEGIDWDDQIRYNEVGGNSPFGPFTNPADETGWVVRSARGRAASHWGFDGQQNPESIPPFVSLEMWLGAGIVEPLGNGIQHASLFDDSLWFVVTGSAGNRVVQIREGEFESSIVTVGIDSRRFHLVIVGDGTNTDIWINGELATTIVGDLTVGGSAFPNAYDRPSLAYDEVAIYDRALTPTEIQNHLLAGIGPGGWAQPCGS